MAIITAGTMGAPELLVGERGVTSYAGVAMGIL
jgi:hypothetical protein